MTKLISVLACLACFIHLRAGNAQGLPGQPPNSYVIGSTWHCVGGYRKEGNRCVNIFDEIGGQPPNSYVIGSTWLCVGGYRKEGNRCVNIFAKGADQTPFVPTIRPDAVTPAQPVVPIVPKSYASADPNVYRVQRNLKSLGYDPGALDGRLGPRTRRAIEVYQRDRGLQSDGKVSQSLANALQAEIQENSQKRTVPQPRETRPKIAAIPRSDWPTWQTIVSELPPARPMSRLSPIEVYEAIKDNVWVIVAGRRTTDFKMLRELSQGSAIAVSAELLLTNCHVVEERPVIAIVQEEEVKEASLVSADPSSDRCILKVTDATLFPIQGVRKFSDLKVGERVYSVGAPSGLERTLGEGIISGLRSSKSRRYVQTTAPISPGSSGGGLFDSSGNLIGVTSFLLKEAQSINFAIAAEDFWR